jgi:hypothetical protein
MMGGREARMSGTRRRLGVEVGAVLAAKAVLLLALYYLFFAPDHQIPNNAAATTVHVMGDR